jgi:hypothetical protein
MWDKITSGGGCKVGIQDAQGCLGRPCLQGGHIMWEVADGGVQGRSVLTMDVCQETRGTSGVEPKLACT